jgi:hypothetical protein
MKFYSADIQMLMSGWNILYKKERTRAQRPKPSSDTGPQELEEGFSDEAAFHEILRSVDYLKAKVEPEPLKKKLELIYIASLNQHYCP